MASRRQQRQILVVGGTAYTHTHAGGLSIYRKVPPNTPPAPTLGKGLAAGREAFGMLACWVAGKEKRPRDERLGSEVH